MASSNPETGSTVRPLIGEGEAGPATADLDLFDATAELAPVARPVPATTEERRSRPGSRSWSRTRSRRRAPSRRRPVVAVAAAVLAVGAIALISGLLGGSDPADRATPDDKTSLPRLVVPSGAGGDDSAASGTPSDAQDPSGTASASGTAAASSSSSASSSASVSQAAADSGSVLKTGERGDSVVELQERLAQLGLYDESVDGKYDGGVRSAVRAFQQAYGIQGDVDGVYGPNTRRELESRTTAP